MKRFSTKGVGGLLLSGCRLAALAGTLASALFSSSALAGTTTYSNAGSFSYMVPGGVSQLQLDVAGAGGGGGGADGRSGGSGDRISATLDVSPGDTIYFTIGAGGQTGWTAGANYSNTCQGGGSGGSGLGNGGAGGAANCTLPGASGLSGGGGGGGGGGGYSGGMGGTGELDYSLQGSTGGSAGQSCYSTDARLSAVQLFTGGGGAGAAGQASNFPFSNGTATNGFVTITTISAPPKPSLTLMAITNGGTGTLNFTGSNGWSDGNGYNITTTASGAAASGLWDTLGPGDTITFKSTYTVTQQDIDLLQ